MIKNTIKLSPEFKKQTTRAVLSILLFLIAYIIIVALALTITVACIYAGIMLLFVPSFLTIILSIGLASMGVLITIFIFKFFFKSHKVDRSHLVEVKREEQPELFHMIDEIVLQVGTDFPKKVYVSAEVNAAVFYDSSFWSMFIPIKKNLQIGLGLINTVTEDELKAILAHEFGHFSQRTMKLGSYVYYVNQIIHNILFDNEGYDKLLQKWANISNYFAIFAFLASKAIQSIIWVLARIYGVVNIGYMGLSREMEFHADEIAAHTTGYEPLKNSLLRMDLAEHSLGMVFRFYEGHISDYYKSRNVFVEQAWVMGFLAEKDQLPIKYNLPDISLEEINKFNKSKLVIKDQWASHPGLNERIHRLEMLNIRSENSRTNVANKIFRNIEDLQEKSTAYLFSGVEYKETPGITDFSTFKTLFEKEYFENTFEAVFNGYYDHKNPEKIDLEIMAPEDHKREVSDLFSQEQVNLVYTCYSLKTDVETLQQISEKKWKIKTFDYDGKRYKKKSIPSLLQELNGSLINLQQEISKNDQDIYQEMLSLEKTSGLEPALKKRYTVLFDFDTDYEKKMKTCQQLSEAMSFINQTHEPEVIMKKLSEAQKIENVFKADLTDLLKDEPYLKAMTQEMKENFNNYLSKNLSYFYHEKYDEHNLRILFKAMDDFYFLMSRGYFLRKKELLTYQASLIHVAPDKLSVVQENLETEKR